jgi:hypothetical protein
VTISFRYLCAIKVYPLGTAHLIQSGSSWAALKLLPQLANKGAGYGATYALGDRNACHRLGPELMVYHNHQAREKRSIADWASEILEYAMLGHGRCFASIAQSSTHMAS